MTALMTSFDVLTTHSFIRAEELDTPQTRAPVLPPLLLLPLHSLAESSTYVWQRHLLDTLIAFISGLELIYVGRFVSL